MDEQDDGKRQAKYERQGDLQKSSTLKKTEFTTSKSLFLGSTESKTNLFEIDDMLTFYP